MERLLFSVLPIFPFPTDVFVQCSHRCFAHCGLVCACSLGCFSMISQGFPSPPEQRPCRPFPGCCFPPGSFVGSSSGLLQSQEMAGNGRQSWINPSPFPWQLCLPKTCISAVKNCSRSPLQNDLFVLKSHAFVQGL